MTTWIIIINILDIQDIQISLDIHGYPGYPGYLHSCFEPALVDQGAKNF